HVARYLTDEQDHRDRVLRRDVDPGRCIGSAWTAGDEADARLAGEAAVAVCHHCRAAFLAADDGLDLRVVQGVENREIAFAGNAEQPVYTVHFKRVDNELAASSHF